MSSELERLLREAGRALPDPDTAVTRRARERALAALRRRRSLRRPLVLAIAVALVGFGVGIGALIAPSGTASPAPVGFGFLPEPGWFVIQSGERPSEGWPALAMAANVPFAPEDSVRGTNLASGYPLRTVERLPRDGVVLVAVFTARGADRFHDARFTAGELKLRVRQPQSPLHAVVNGHNVEVFVYFAKTGPSPLAVAAAQRQLDRLLVASAPSMRRAQVSPRIEAGASARIVDRTFSCRVVPFATLNVWASSPYANTADPELFKGYLAVVSGASATRPLLYVRQRSRPAGGYPSQAGVYARTGARGCVASRRPVPLTTSGLPGPPVQWAKVAKCTVRGRVVVRVRATISTAGLWQRVNPTYLGARGNIAEATIAVRSEATGRPLALVKVDRQSRTRLWTSSACS
jgi:hypothetical protein